MTHYFYITPEEYEEAELKCVHKKMLNNRVHNLGWDKERAINTPPIVRNRNLNQTYAKIAKENGISLDSFAYRINHGWSLEEASTTPIMDLKVHMRELGKASRKYPKELIALAEENGIPIKTFYKRIEIRKMDPYAAATTPLIVGTERALLGKQAAMRNGNLY